VNGATVYSTSAWRRTKTMSATQPTFGILAVPPWTTARKELYTIIPNGHCQVARAYRIYTSQFELYKHHISTAQIMHELHLKFFQMLAWWSPCIFFPGSSRHPKSIHMHVLWPHCCLYHPACYLGLSLVSSSLGTTTYLYKMQDGAYGLHFCDGCVAQTSKGYPY